jgi:hypothetical protein
MAEIRDYNGTGDWSGAAVIARYGRIAGCRRQRRTRELRIQEHTQGSVTWRLPVMDQVIEGIKDGDAACVELGVQFIETGGPQPFGKRLHANTARALRGASLAASQIVRLRERILGMLARAEVPREFSEYTKLLRRIGLGSEWQRVAPTIDRSNPHVMKHVAYLEKHAIEVEDGGVEQADAADEAPS